MADSDADSLRVLTVPGLLPLEGHAAWRDPQVLVWSAEMPLSPDHGRLMILNGARDLEGKMLPPHVRLLPARSDSLAPPWEAQALPP